MEKNIPEIIYQDNDLAVINKPAGMIVNNADTSRDEYTVQDFITEKFKVKNSKLKIADETEFENRGGIVHRLDKETSGVLIVAFNPESFVALQKQFKEKTIEKVYTALCHGKIVEEGEINVPIGRLPWNRMRFGVLPQGRESYTKFKVVQYLTLQSGNHKEILSLVEVHPQTGRTHQIRVHFQYVGHPLFGDVLYAGRKTKSFDRKLLERHFLHASKITFLHPKTGENMSFNAPLSSELKKFLEKLAPYTNIS